ncbi:MAG: hypothetical protein EOP39_00810 [Rubrivivax sp.]|nr:MAG: hypothetical protein EOP39_00810 [Rubrivivax sp.]
MTTYAPPYTVTVTSTAGGAAHCTYVDGMSQPVPAGTVLTTTSLPGQFGSLKFKFMEAVVDNKSLRLVGAAVKTVGNDATMGPDNYLAATRDNNNPNQRWIDSVVVTWDANTYTVRGVVLLFAEVNAAGDLINFYPTSDPKTQNIGLTGE